MEIIKMASAKTTLSVLSLSFLFAVSPARAVWQQQDKLSGENAFDAFGDFVSVDGDYAVVGVPGMDYMGDGVGVAMIYKRMGVEWVYQQWIGDFGLPYDRFGSSVSISGDYVIVGDPNHDNPTIDSGAAHIYKRDGDTWTWQATLAPLDSAPYDHFGYPVSIYGDYALVGAYDNDDNGFQSGSAYIFHRVGEIWTQLDKLLPSDNASGDAFGFSVSIGSEFAIVGAVHDDDKGTDSGSAYVYWKGADGHWHEYDKLIARDGAAGARFGWRVAISGSYAIVGAPMDTPNGHGSGSAYIFWEYHGSPWRQRAKLTPSDGAAGDNFGFSVAIDREIAVVGAPYDGNQVGSAYVFEPPSSGWADSTETAKLTASDGADDDRFGGSVSISGKYAIIGAAYDDDGGDDSGSAYVFRKVMRDDDGVFEYGMEWVSDYDGSENDLPVAETDARGLSEVLRGALFTKVFEKSNGTARVEHWSSDEDNDYVDKVDLAYFSGHGGEAFDLTHWTDLHGPAFKERWTSDDVVTPGDADDSYGDIDAEWIAFMACEVLSDDNGKYWSYALNGAHLILGFSTVAMTPGQGKAWALAMTGDKGKTPSKRVVYSWFQATDEEQPDGTVALAIGETSNMSFDYLWGQGDGPEPDPVDDDHFTRWKHVVGQAIQVPESASGGLEETSMTRYSVTPKSVDETYVSNLGATLGMSGTVEYRDGIYYLADESKHLRVSENEGVSYGDTDELWKGSVATPVLPTLGDAESAAVTFLSTNGLLPSDAAAVPSVQYNDHQALAEKETGVVLEEFPLDVQISFERDMIGGYPVVGAGGRLLLYYGENLAAPIGMTIVWRDIAPAGSVNIFTESEVLNLFNSYGRKVALNLVPYHDDIVILQTFLGYYEKGFGRSQTELIPVYILSADFLVDGDVESSGLIYVPAASTFVPPVAEITGPGDGARFPWGESISFTGTASYGTAPYDYSWRSSQNRNIGNGPSIQVSGLSHGEHTITLEVTDNDGTVGKDMITITVDPPPQRGGGGDGGKKLPKRPAPDGRPQD